MCDDRPTGMGDGSCFGVHDRMELRGSSRYARSRSPVRIAIVHLDRVLEETFTRFNAGETVTLKFSSCNLWAGQTPRWVHGDLSGRAEVVSVSRDEGEIMVEFRKREWEFSGSSASGVDTRGRFK